MLTREEEAEWVRKRMEPLSTPGNGNVTLTAKGRWVAQRMMEIDLEAFSPPLAETAELTQRRAMAFLRALDDWETRND